MTEMSILIIDENIGICKYNLTECEAEFDYKNNVEMTGVFYNTEIDTRTDTLDYDYLCKLFQKEMELNLKHQLK